MKLSTKFYFIALIAGACWLAIWGMTTPVAAAPIPGETAPRPRRVTQEVGGHITADTTWDVSGSPYVFTRTVTVDAGVVLTVSPGVIVQGCPDCELLVQGSLHALGTATQPITFTSTEDSGPGEWSGIVINGGSGSLRHTVIRYGGDLNSVGTYGNLSLKNAGDVRLESCAIRETGVSGADYGIYALNSHLVISDTHFYHNGTTSGKSEDFALYATGAATVITVTDNLFEHNYGYAIGITPTLLSGLQSNTFTGDESSYSRRILVPGGQTSDGGQFVAQPGAWGYELSDDLIVPSGITLTASDGALIRARDNVELLVQGQLNAIGAHAPVTFTSFYDSAPRQWSGLVFAGGYGTLDNVTVRYAGDANSLGGHSNLAISSTLTQPVKLINSRILSESYSTLGGSGTDYGVAINTGRVLISGTLFAGNGTLDSSTDCALFIADAKSAITLTHNTFRQNNAYAIGLPPAQINRITDNTFEGDVGKYTRRVLLAGGSLPPDGKFLYQQGLAGYELQDDLTVPLTATLIISPQVSVMGRANVELLVRGRLQARGDTAPITFTSAADSAPNQWSGLTFDQGGGDLRHVVVRYGGQVNSLGVHSNIAVSGTLTHTFSLVAGRVYSESYNPLIGAKDDYGLWIQNSHATISGTTFAQNGSSSQDYALRADGAATFITATNNLFANNGGYDAYLPSSLINRFHSNTFTGTVGFRRIVLGAGDIPTKGLLQLQTGLEGYELAGIVHVPSGITLTVQPGIAVMGRADQELIVSGRLVAEGSETHPITFTSSADSAPKQWAGVLFANGSGTLRHTVVRYAGNANSLGVCGGIVAVNVLSSPLAIADSLITANGNDGGLGGTADYGLYLTNSRAILTRTQITANGDNSKDYGVYLTGGSVLTDTANVINANGGNGLGLDNGQATSFNTQINGNDVNGINLNSSGSWLANEVTIASNGGSGIEMNGGRLAMTCVQIHNNTDYGIHVTGNPAQFQISYNGLYDNGQYDFYNEGSTRLDVRDNWWGANADPVIAGKVSGSVFYVPWLEANVCLTEIGVSQQDAPDPVLAGDVLTYTVTVTNAGPSRATSVVLSDTLDAQADFITATTATTGATCSLLTGTVRCELGTLPVGETITAWVTVRPRDAGTLTNTVRVATADEDRVSTNNSATLTTTVQPAVDLGVTVHALDPAPVQFPLSYTLTISNAGPSTAHHVILTHTFPVTQVAVPTACQNTSGTIVCTWSTLAAHTSASATLIITPTEKGPLTTSTKVTSDEPDLGHFSNAITHTLMVVDAADLRVSQSATTPAYVASVLAYTLTVSNDGPSAAEGVVLYDTLPPEVTYLASGNGCTFGQQVLTCSLGTLAVGTQRRVTVTVRTGDELVTLTNRISATTATTDPRPADNSFELSTALQPVADLSVGGAAPTSAPVGETFTGTWQLSNNGPSPASNVQITISIPAEVNVRTVSPTGACSVGDAVTCHWAQLSPNAGITVSLGLSATQSGTASFQATVAAAEFDGDRANNKALTQVQITPAARLRFSSAVSPDPASAGEPYTTTLVLTNEGPDPAHTIVLYTEIPLSTTLFSSSTSPSATAILPTPRSITYTFDSLTVGNSVTVTLVSQVSPAARGTLQEPVRYSATESPRQTASVSTALVARNDLHVTQLASTATLTAGQSLTLTGIISNSGPADALEPTLTFAWGEAFTFTALQGAELTCTTAPTGSVCQWPPLSVGDAAAFTLTMRSQTSFQGEATITTTLSDTAEELAPDDNQALSHLNIRRSEFDVYLPLMLRNVP